MKKLMNAADTVLAESLDGFAASHADIVVLGPERKFVRRRAPKPGKVALLSGGGSGHEPLHAGFVGVGMLDAACAGQVFTAPTPDQMAEAAAAVDGGAGCLFIVKNYEGDVMNFEMAAEIAGREVRTVVTDDDVAVETSTYSTGRRGVAGTLVVEKMVGAAAEAGRDLAALEALGKDVNARTRSMGGALTSCTVAAAGTPALELYLMANAVRRVLGAAGLTVARCLTGSYVTSLEMAGCSVTITALDDSLVALWDAPVHTAALRW